MKTDSSRLAVLVHEVRSPVAALGAIAETFEQESDPAALRELSRLAVAACRAIDRLVTDWAPDSVSSDRVDVATLVRDAVAGVARNGVDVEVRIDPDLSGVDADAVRLRQALDNLLANAVQHGGGLGIVVDVGARDGELRLSVVDRGPGVPVEDQKRIFEPGVSLDPSRPGSGLGLGIARAIAEAHGGALTVTSAGGEGATFTLTLPMSGTV